MTRIPTKRSEVFIVDMDEVITGDVSVVTLTADIQYDENLEFHGVAKRHPNDRANADVARLLATARAYRHLADGLEKRANGLVTHNDDINDHKHRIKENWASHSRRRRYWQKKNRIK